MDGKQEGEVGTVEGIIKVRSKNGGANAEATIWTALGLPPLFAVENMEVEQSALFLKATAESGGKNVGFGKRGKSLRRAQSRLAVGVAVAKVELGPLFDTHFAVAWSK